MIADIGFSGCGGGSSSTGEVGNTPAVIAVTMSPTTASVATSGTQSFKATVSNDSANKGATWSLSCAAANGCGSLSATTSASGTPITYTAPTALPNPATVTLTATSVTDGTKSASATITITSGSSGSTISVTISPKAMGLVLNQSLGLTATVTNDVNGAGVTWTASSGTFSAQAATTATYVAPNSPGSGITITATSKADATKSATATIAVTDLAGVTTYHNDVARDGANNQEYLLTTSNVNQSSFGKLFSCTVDGAVYAQPLWVPNVNIGGGTHNVIVVATMRDSVYAFDADANPCRTYWHQTLVPSGETYGASSDVGTSDIFPDIGILGTPVIDSTTQTIYLVSKTKTSSTNYIQRLHALSLAAGAEATNSPVTIAATFPGTCEGGSTDTFNSLTENQRAALALSNGMVYVAWASHGDEGTYQGWILGYQTTNLTAVPTVFVDDPNTCQGGIWMSGGAPAFDSAGNMYVISGNGGFNGTSGSLTLPTDFGDSYIKLNTPSLAVLDYFTPFNQATLAPNDDDAGASGTSVLIDGTGSGNFLVGGSKSGTLYLINRGNMGKYNTASDGVAQEWTPSPATHSFSTPAFWNNNLYYFGVVSDYGSSGDSQPGQAFAFNTSTAKFDTSSTSATPTGFGFAGATPSISGSSATEDGIVWALDTGKYGTSDNGSAAAGPAVLHAYDATNLGNELWNSSQNASRDQAGNAVKFTVPTVANGKVYIGTRGSDNTVGGGTTFGEIDVYGLLP